MQLLGPLWTIATEVQFYLCFFIIVLLILFSNKLVLAICILIFLPTINLLVSNFIVNFETTLIQPRTLIGNLPFFIWGIILALLYQYRLKIHNAVAIKILLITILTFVATYLYNYYPKLFWGIGLQNSYGGQISLLIVAIVLMLEEKKLRVSNIFYTKIYFLTDIGRKCYGIYVWHSVSLLKNKLLKLDLVGFSLFLFLLLSIPLSYISYAYFERWFLRLKF